VVAVDVTHAILVVSAVNHAKKRQFSSIRG
jgi:hypothetical protein